MDDPPVQSENGAGSPSPSDPGYAPVDRHGQKGEGYAVFWVDLSGRVTRWAESCTSMFGHAGSDVPRSFGDLFVERDRARGIPALVLRHARDLGSWDGTGWRMRFGDEPFWAATSVSLVRTPNGLPIGFMVVTRDVTRLRALGVGADGDDRARLASLGRVASEVSHDVRNILAAIRGFANALERLDPGNGSSDAVRAELLKACDRGTLLTQRLLGVGRSTVEGVGPTDLGALVRDAEPLLRQVLPRRIELRIRIDGGLPEVHTRRADAELALLNLVINARDAILEQGRIEVSVHPATSHGDVSMSVRDSGSGMSKEVLSRCRERAFTTKDSGGGTGLGLGIVQEAAREFGGSFWIDSTPGGGTTATVSFRAYPAGGAPARVGARALEAGSVILLWGVSPLSGDLLANLLRRNRRPVVRVDSRDRALEEIASLGPKLALLVIDGSDAAREAEFVLQTLPAAACSLLITATPVEGRIAHGFDQQLVGPTDPDALLACVSELSRRPTERSLRSIH